MSADLLAVLIVLAGLMVLAIAYLVKWSGEVRTAGSAAVVVFLLVMMVAMFVGALLYLQHPTAASEVEGLWLAGLLMSVSVFPLVSILFRDIRDRAEQGERYVPRPIPDRRSLAAALVGLLVLNELLMGRCFELAAGAGPAAVQGGLAGFASLLGTTIASPWYLFAMASEMGLSALLLRGQLPRPLLRVLLLQAGIMFLAPPAVANAQWVDLSAVGSGTFMVLLFVDLVLAISHDRAFARRAGPYALELVAVFTLMGLGLFLWALGGGVELFALSVVLQMVVFFVGLTDPLAGGTPPAPVTPVARVSSA